MVQIIRKCRQNRGNRASGFAFVELIVIVAILAFMVALLLPMVARTRAGANQAQCQNNLQQIFASLKSYASDNQGQVPLGYIAGIKQQSYFIYNQNNHTGTNAVASLDPTQPNYAKSFASGTGSNWGIGHTVTTLGLMVPTYVADGSVLYCPAGVASGKGIQYKNEGNPWPFPLDHDPKNYQNQHTRIDYCQRPVANFGNQFFPIQPGQDQGTYVPAPFPKLADLGTKAVLCDSLAQDLAIRHVDGINVIYADGAVAYVPLQQFNADLTAMRNAQDAASNAAVLDESNAKAPSGIWADLDQAHPAVAPAGQ